MTEPTRDEEEGPKTDTVDIKGRDVEIRELNDAQLALMAREVQILQRESVENKRKVAAVATMFTVLESVIINDADREYMNDLVIAGKLDLRELTSFISVFREDQKVVKKVRRGRPPVKRS